MATILEKLKNRRKYPVKIGDTEVFVRSLTIGELNAQDKLPNDLTSLFVVGSSLVNDDGSLFYPRGNGESNEEYARRMQTELEFLGADDFLAIIQATQKLLQPVDQETLAKN